jgi:hypothetical protein
MDNILIKAARPLLKQFLTDSNLQKAEQHVKDFLSEELNEGEAYISLNVFVNEAGKVEAVKAANNKYNQVKREIDRFLFKDFIAELLKKI